MRAAGLPAGPVLNVDEAMAADHTAHRHMVYGPAARVREGVEQWREAGITTPVLVPLSPILRLAPLFGIVVARFSAFRQFPVLKRHIGQAVSRGGHRCFLLQSAHGALVVRPPVTCLCPARLISSHPTVIDVMPTRKLRFAVGSPVEGG